MAKTLWVSPSGSEWRVHWEKESGGTACATKEEAIREARKMVKDRREGEVASIRVQKANGVIEEEWTYGKDPYPPKG